MTKLIDLRNTMELIIGPLLIFNFDIPSHINISRGPFHKSHIITFPKQMGFKLGKLFKSVNGKLQNLSQKHTPFYLSLIDMNIFDLNLY